LGFQLHAETDWFGFFHLAFPVKIYAVAVFALLRLEDIFCVAFLILSLQI